MIEGFKKIIASFILFWIYTSISYTQSVKIDAKLDTNTILIGDQIKYTITVAKNKDAVIKFPIFSDKLTENIEIINISGLDSVYTTNNRIEIRQQLVLSVYDTGLFIIPPVNFFYSDKNVKDTIQSSANFIKVLPVRIDSSGIIRDIKPPFKVPVRFIELLPFILAVVILSFIVWFYFYYRRKKRNNKPLFWKAKPVEASDLIAVRELDKLKSEKLWQKNEVKRYYSRLTEIIRKYLENRHGIAAMEQTTNDILLFYRKLEVKIEESDTLLEKILIEADLVKFAKLEPLPTDNEICIENAYTFINMTKYKPVAISDEDLNKQKAIKE